MKEYLVSKWDYLVYKIAHQSLNRIVKSNPGIAYLVILHMESWLIQHPITPELERATEEFFRTLPHEHIESTKGI